MALTKSQITSRAQAAAHAVLRRRYKIEYDAAYKDAKALLEAGGVVAEPPRPDDEEAR